MGSPQVLDITWVMWCFLCLHRRLMIHGDENFPQCSLRQNGASPAHADSVPQNWSLKKCFPKCILNYSPSQHHIAINVFERRFQKMNFKKLTQRRLEMSWSLSPSIIEIQILGRWVFGKGRQAFGKGLSPTHDRVKENKHKQIKSYRGVIKKVKRKLNRKYLF